LEGLDVIKEYKGGSDENLRDLVAETLVQLEKLSKNLDHSVEN